MKAVIFCLLVGQSILAQTELNRITFGIGAGYNHLFEDIYKPSLTTDSSKSLRLQELSRDNFVISSTVIFKLGKLQADETTNNLLDSSGSAIGFFSAERFSVNLAINLLEVNSDNISFNKSIDGGIGVGYFVSPAAQIALFLDMARYRQLQDYVVENYNGAPIPNGEENFNALDENNSDLFYTKTVPAISLKLVFSLGNKS